MGKDRFLKRKKRVRSKIFGTIKRPRLTVFRSNKSIYAQIIDDDRKVTLLGISAGEITPDKSTKIKKASLLGEKLAKEALKKKIKRVVFDKSGYKYHGRIKAFADGARKGGLQF